LAANTVGLRDWLRERRGLELADYEALRRWSVDHLADFWQALWDYFELASPTPHRQALADPRMPGARWFEGARLNYVDQVLRHASASDAAGAAALVFRNERLQREGRSIEISWSTLAGQAAALAATLQQLGVQRGDRVAAYLPNIPQAVVGFLACASLGAIWSMCAPDMGVATVRDRFRQIEPKVLIAADGTVYGARSLIGARRWGRCSRSCRACRRSSSCLPGRGWRRRRAVRIRSGCLARPRADLGRRARRVRSCRIRAGAVRPPALDRLQQRHHRVAEGDRAWPRRRCSRDAEAACVPPRPAAERGDRRALPLVQQLGLGDVESARLGAAARHDGVSLRRAIRRSPNPIRCGAMPMRSARPSSALAPRTGLLA
jgi:hypothetical protein